MATRAAWDDLVEVVRGLADRQEGPPVRGKFTIKGDPDLVVLRTCLDAHHDTHLELINEEQPSDLKVGQTVELSVAPRLGFGLLKHDIGDLLLGSRRARIKDALILSDGRGNLQ